MQQALPIPRSITIRFAATASQLLRLGVDSPDTGTRTRSPGSTLSSEKSCFQIQEPRAMPVANMHDCAMMHACCSSAAGVGPHPVAPDMHTCIRGANGIDIQHHFQNARASSLQASDGMFDNRLPSTLLPINHDESHPTPGLEVGQKHRPWRPWETAESNGARNVVMRHSPEADAPGADHLTTSAYSSPSSLSSVEWNETSQEGSQGLTADPNGGKRQRGATESPNALHEPPAKRTRYGAKRSKGEPEIECIWHVANGRSDPADAKRWPTLSEMHRHARKAHGKFMCEECFEPFETEEQRLEHKDYDANPCFRSCRDAACHRRRPLSLRHLTHCDHLFTTLARWQAAFRAAEAIIHGHTSNDLRNSPSLEQQQQHMGGEGILTNALSQPSNETGGIEAGTAQDARDAPLRKSQARLQHLLATACHELWAVGSPSLRVGASFRTALSIDAPNILAEIERIDFGIVREPMNTNQTHSAWHQPPAVSELASNGTNDIPCWLSSSAKPNNSADIWPLAPLFPEQDTGTMPSMNPSGIPRVDSTMPQVPSDVMPFYSNDYGTAASWNMASAMYPMPTQADSAYRSDYYSQSSGGPE